MADHIIHLTITNNSKSFAMNLSGSAWFDSGEFAPTNGSFSTLIAAGGGNCLTYMQDKPGLAGVSGYVNYNINNVTYTIGYSNPITGSNKIGFGFNDGIGSDNTVWEDMTDHYSNPFTIVAGSITAVVESSSGTINTCTVTITDTGS